MSELVRYASGTTLDLIGELFAFSRGMTKHGKGQSKENDSSFSARLQQEIWRPTSPSASEQLMGLSLRAVLHFDSNTTQAQQNNERWLFT